MIYGSKGLVLGVILSLALFLVVGCSNQKNFSYDLYDGYQIKRLENEIQLYKDNQLVLIGGENYQIEEIKYNSDVVCMKVGEDIYYMVYYFDSSVYGPYTLETLNETTASLSMTFPNDFQNILKVEGLVYE